MADRQLDLFGAPAATPRGVGAATVAAALRALAARLPAELRLGTSSWSFPGWSGIVYDRAATPTRLARDGLAAYARHPLLRTVGVDRTYYAPIDSAVFAAYAAAVPDDFRFVVKAPETLTAALFPRHPRYGVDAGARNAGFLDAAWASEAICAPMALGLGDKAGVLVFQFPPQSPAPLGGAARFAERLHAFLVRLPRAPMAYAVELRNADLLGTSYADALAAAGACHVVNVHPSMPPPAAQAALTDRADAPARVVRWMLGHGQDYEAARERYRPFDRLVDPDPLSRAAIADLCRVSAARRRPAYVVINNKAEGSAPLSAIELARQLAAAEGGVP
ncbi:MAG: DUF72 domain-containing protein [Deltaproteobacteria bacterium]|nr:DUF72 domain-containing protein [Deltaproteobacteria bacterium]